MFWISMGFVRLTSWWWVILGAGEGVLVPGLASVWLWGVFGSGRVPR